jgi:hypothetical protein
METDDLDVRAVLANRLDGLGQTSLGEDVLGSGDEDEPGHPALHLDEITHGASLPRPCDIPASVCEYGRWNDLIRRRDEAGEALASVEAEGGASLDLETQTLQASRDDLGRELEGLAQLLDVETELDAVAQLLVLLPGPRVALGDGRAC